jgi:hypothetical protein
MYDKVNTLDHTLENIVMKMNPRKVLLEMEDDLEVAAMFSKLRARSDMQISKQTRKAQRSCMSGNESDYSSSQSE